VWKSRHSRVFSLRENASSVITGMRLTCVPSLSTPR
jgi:hypothetical protein